MNGEGETTAQACGCNPRTRRRLGWRAGAVLRDWQMDWAARRAVLSG